MERDGGCRVLHGCSAADHADEAVLPRGVRLREPDKAEFFIPRTDGNGSYQQGARAGGGRPVGAFQLDACEYRMYNEAAVERFSFFIDLGYRHIDPDFLPTAAGFTDIELGTKSMLLDCELTQITFQFKTYIPAGNAGKGLGTGHLSLDRRC